MPHPQIQPPPPEFQFYRARGRLEKREFERGSLPGLEKSLSKAHDNLATQVGINTRLYRELTQAKNDLGRERIWRRVLVTTNCGLWAIVLILLKEFLSRI